MWISCVVECRITTDHLLCRQLQQRIQLNSKVQLKLWLNSSVPVCLLSIYQPRTKECDFSFSLQIMQLIIFCISAGSILKNFLKPRKNMDSTCWWQKTKDFAIIWIKSWNKSPVHSTSNSFIVEPSRISSHSLSLSHFICRLANDWWNS